MSTHNDERSNMNQHRIEEAAQRRAEAEAQLYRDDGSKVYGDDEHRERLAAIKARHRAEFDQIDADVGRRVAEAEEALLVAENADLASTLTTDELSRVSALSGFIADDVERLSPADLVKRCRAALAASDRPTLFALAHHVARRGGEEEDLEVVEEFGEVVAQMRAKLAPDQERKVAQAREVLEQARGLEEMAYYRRRGVTDAYGLYAQGAYGTSGS
jgi:hypothetical protein